MNKRVLMSGVLSLAVLFAVVTQTHAANTPTAPMQYTQGVAQWTATAGTKCYNVYYKEKSDKKYMYSVRCLPNNMLSYTIKYLKQGGSYVYNVSALSYSGKETAWSGEKPLMTIPMQ